MASLDRPDGQLYYEAEGAGPGADLRARARRQPPVLVAAGAALPRPLHLRHLRPPRLLALDRRARADRPARLRRRPRRADRSPPASRRAAGGAVDGRLDLSGLRAARAATGAGAGARLHRRRAPTRTSIASSRRARFGPARRPIWWRGASTRPPAPAGGTEQPALHHLYQALARCAWASIPRRCARRSARCAPRRPSPP